MTDDPTPPRRIQETEGELVAAGLDYAWVFDYLPSTMNEARSLLLTQGDSSSVRLGVVLANEQRAGRGRQGREWIGAASAHCATFVSVLPTDVAALQGFALAVGCAVAGAIEDLAGTVGLKWPNDILVYSTDTQWRKVGGILVEADSTPSGVALSIGIGINLAGAPPEVETATDLEREFRKSISNLQLCAAIGKQLRPILERFAIHKSGFEPYRNEWMYRCMHKGYCIRIDQGATTIEGIVTGVSRYGALEVETHQGLVTVVSGHVLSLQPVHP